MDKSKCSQFCIQMRMIISFESQRFPSRVKARPAPLQRIQTPSKLLLTGLQQELILLRDIKIYL